MFVDPPRNILKPQDDSNRQQQNDDLDISSSPRKSRKKGTLKIPRVPVDKGIFTYDSIPEDKNVMDYVIKALVVARRQAHLNMERFDSFVDQFGVDDKHKNLYGLERKRGKKVFFFPFPIRVVVYLEPRQEHHIRAKLEALPKNDDIVMFDDGVFCLRRLTENGGRASAADTKRFVWLLILRFLLLLFVLFLVCCFFKNTCGAFGNLPVKLVLQFIK